MNFTFDGHIEARRRGIRVLNHEELQAGDVSLEYVSRLMHRRYTDSPTIRKVLQTLWYQVNSGQEIYVVGVDPRRTAPSAAGRAGAPSSRSSATSRSSSSTRRRTAGSSGPAADWKGRGKDTPAITHPHFTGHRHARRSTTTASGHRGPVHEVVREIALRVGARRRACTSGSSYWQMFEFGASGTDNFHFSGVTPGSSVSASQIKSEMHLLPSSFGWTPIPDVVWLRSIRTPGVAGSR